MEERSYCNGITTFGIFVQHRSPSWPVEEKYQTVEEAGNRVKEVMNDPDLEIRSYEPWGYIKPYTCKCAACRAKREEGRAHSR